VDPALNTGPFGLVAWNRRGGEVECGGAGNQGADEGVERVVALPAAIQRVLVEDQGGQRGEQLIEGLARTMAPFSFL
jgi:hypothetical protein